MSTVYAWGDHPQGRFAAGMDAVPGQVTDAVLRLETFGNGAEVSYTFLDNGSIEGRYVLNGETSIGRFTRTRP